MGIAKGKAKWQMQEHCMNYEEPLFSFQTNFPVYYLKLIQKKILHLKAAVLLLLNAFLVHSIYLALSPKHSTWLASLIQQHPPLATVHHCKLRYYSICPYLAVSLKSRPHKTNREHSMHFFSKSPSK